MSSTAEILFEYLRSSFYQSPDEEPRLDLDILDDEYQQLGKALIYMSQCVSESRKYATALGKGDLSASLPTSENEIAAPLKSLQANLRHLTWQTQQVAKGDYQQRVDFMGEFADAFNTMVEQLSDRQQKLEEEILLSQKHATAMEQSNLLLSKLIHNVPGQIFVISTIDNRVLLTNESARRALDIEPGYLANLIDMLPAENTFTGNRYYDVQFTKAAMEHYLTINTYPIEWQDRNAVALVINDVSVEKRQLKSLEDCAYRDVMTNVYNRFYGMLTLDEWLAESRQFALIFIDLDNLKYVNDQFGHGHGDEYIMRVAKHLESFSEDSVVCRIGGDEYMLLVPHADIEDVYNRMDAIQQGIEQDKYLEDKDYLYSISIGIVSVDADNDLSSSEILSIADERMYEHKRAKKKRGSAQAS